MQKKLAAVALDDRMFLFFSGVVPLRSPMPSNYVENCDRAVISEDGSKIGMLIAFFIAIIFHLFLIKTDFFVTLSHFEPNLTVSWPRINSSTLVMKKAQCSKIQL